MSSWLNSANGDLLDHIHRDDSIAEIVRQLNSKVHSPKTPDSIETLRKTHQKEFQHTIYNTSNVIKEASPQFIKDVNIVVKIFENNTYVEVLINDLVSE